MISDIESGASSAPWRGHLDSADHLCVAGWALDPSRPQTKAIIRIFDNGVPLADVVADQHREDLQAAGIGDGGHAFRLEFAVPLLRTQRHVIEAREAGEGHLLVGSPRILEAEPVLTQPPIAERAPAPWRGNLDIVTRERIAGWAWDPRTPDQPLSLLVLDNGEVIAKLLANRYRQDLAVAAIGDGRHGFSWKVPGSLDPLKSHVIQVVGELDGCEMPTSPAVIPASGGFDAGLEAAVRTAVDGMASAPECTTALQFLAQQMERLLKQNADLDARREARQIRYDLNARWGKVAVGITSAHSPAVAAAAARRVLVIDAPEPEAIDAASHAILSHMRALQALGFEVSCVCADMAAREDVIMEENGFHQWRPPYYTCVEDVLRRQANCFDIVYIHGAANAARYLALAGHYQGRARIIYGVDYLHYLRLGRRARLEEEPNLAALSEGFRQTELMAAARANVVITHSGAEAQLLRKALPGCNVHVVPWSVPVRPTPVPWIERRGLAFIGNYNHAANADGARFLVERILPRVWTALPDLPCLLVGGGSQAAIADLSSARVQIVGHVAQLGTIFDRVRLTVAPLRYGAGVKGKVLDSLGAGVPCIMSPIAAEGIALPASMADTIVPDVQQLAAQIVRFHEDGEAAARIAQAGQEFVGRHYCEAVVRELLKAAVEGRRASPAPGSAPGPG